MVVAIAGYVRKVGYNLRVLNVTKHLKLTGIAQNMPVRKLALVLNIFL